MSGEGKQKTRWRNIALGVMSLAIIAFGFPLVDEMFEAHVSQGLAFVLTAATAMFVFVALGSFFGPQQTPRSSDDDKGKAYPILRALLFLVVIAAAASWSAMAYIETNALTQPDHATGAFTVAVHLKSVVRYMTPEQYRIDQIANWIFFGGGFVMFGTALVGRFWRRWRDDGS